MTNRVRQLTGDEAHVLDHLVDAVMTTGSLITDKVERPLLLRGADIIGSFQGLQQYVLNKIERLHARPVEAYDERDAPPQRTHLRLPFDADPELVREQGADVLEVYKSAATFTHDPNEGRDVSLDAGERLNFAQKARAKQMRKEKK